MWTPRTSYRRPVDARNWLRLSNARRQDGIVRVFPGRRRRQLVVQRVHDGRILGLRSHIFLSKFASAGWGDRGAVSQGSVAKKHASGGCWSFSLRSFRRNQCLRVRSLARLPSTHIHRSRHNVLSISVPFTFISTSTRPTGKPSCVALEHERHFIAIPPTRISGSHRRGVRTVLALDASRSSTKTLACTPETLPVQKTIGCR